MSEKPLFGEIIALPLADIEVSDRLRPVDPAHVEAIAASIGQIGLTQPITVRPEGNRWRLIAGAHRLAAVQSLGWESIDAVIQNLEPDEARLVEIDENLMRRELSALDRAIFLAERKEVYERAFPETKRLGRKPKKMSQTLRHFGERFSKDAAKRTGLSERTIQLAIEMVAKLDPDARAALRLSELADNQAHLVALAAMPAEEQRAIAAKIATGEARSVKEARIGLGFDTLVEESQGDRLFRSFMALWGRADGKTRRRIAAHVRLTGPKEREA